ncbi:NEQ417 [Nanoarchaeum equitans Kin4-M]|uniref:NEQ417 n=1 Tax=Nanoarchaeum equitans (strain Kin4-M) TaxID=228908 RepID=Q74N31_NANEQ|nr:NEQ417 [Nanoarchaeum equitans Kin4-M]
MDLKEYVLKGFFYPASEIYNSIAGFYDYGYLGTLLKNNFINEWKNYFLRLHPNFWEVDPAIVMPKEVFIASGHLENFNDPIVECKNGHRFRADHLIEEKLNIKAEGLSLSEMEELLKNVRCPICNAPLGKVKWFNLMFPIYIGPDSQEALNLLKNLKENVSEQYIKDIIERVKKMVENEAYLRPETAQGPYVMFKREFILHRQKLPLGLAVVGKAFRNEISPRQLLLRLREFTQAELQIFFDPEDNEFDINEVKDVELNFLDKEGNYKRIKVKDLPFPEFYAYFVGKVKQFYERLGIPEERLRFRELSEKEKAFYNKYHVDIEINFPTYGWKEVGGIHYRTDHDLSGHMKVSGKDLTVQKDNKKFIPHVLELSFGVDRNVLALIDLFLTEEEYEIERDNQKVKEKRVVLKIPKHLAPIKVAVFPLLKKPELIEKAKEVYNMLKNYFYPIIYDEQGSIGRRYRRVDEIGVPYAITIDYQTLEDNTVTIRDRDTMKQVRVKIEDLPNQLTLSSS